MRGSQRIAWRCPGHAFECFARRGAMAKTLAKTTCEADAAACNTAGVGYCDCKATKGCFGPLQVCVTTGKGNDEKQECRGCDLGTNNGPCAEDRALRCAAETATCQ